jgi:hypothetical protein
MKRLLLILILTFSFQTLTKADDIRDFQIEGMSIGDSLLDYMKLSEIKKKMKTTYPGSKKFSRLFTKLPNLTTYESVQFHFKTNDKKFLIYAISGHLYFKKNIKECYKKKSKILGELKASLPNMKNKSEKKKHSLDDASFIDVTYFYPESGGFISLACYDWSIKMAGLISLRSVVRSHFPLPF